MAGDGPALRALLEHIREARGFDFTGYKLPSLQRRLAKRLEAVGVDSYDDYRDFLELHPDEYAQLFDTVLINVTGFFRDPDAWSALAAEGIPAVLDAHPRDAPIRVWSAGAASGEEAFTIAMLLAEAVGERAFRERVKVYGTDVDDDALDQARLATYDAERLEDIPPSLRGRYFESVSGRWCFRREMRRNVIFGRNDLVRDAPISRIDLLICRNTLMYFNSETQAQILRRFNFALRPTGLLFLGKSEMLLTQRTLFEPVNTKRRIFRKVTQRDERPIPELLAAGGAGAGQDARDLAERAFEAAPAAQLVIDRDRRLRLFNEAARRLLRLGAPDIGRPIRELEISYRPAELRGPLDTAFDDRSAVSLGSVSHRHDGRDRLLEVRIEPIGADTLELASVSFVDITARQEFEQRLELANRELSTAYEELQSTVEELETTNEELQSTNEELETTNEELQSTNEELETMNEELESANEELGAINDELRQRTLALDEANVTMDAVLTSLGIGIVTVDRDERIRQWNAHSEDLWGVRSHEVVGMRFGDLDIGLPVGALRAGLRESLLDGGHVSVHTVDAVDRRGRAFSCAVTFVPLQVDGDPEVAAVVLAQRARVA